MNRAKLLLLAALVLPLAGLSAVWAMTDRASREGREWLVPVAGYDPMDRFQGHYVQYRIAWPGLEREDGSSMWLGGPLCIEGAPPQISRAIENEAGKRCANPVSAASADSGRLYASHEAALEIERKLADPKLKGTLRFRLRPDGRIVPLEITFTPLAPGERAPGQPVLTPAEIAVPTVQ